MRQLSARPRSAPRGAILWRHGPARRGRPPHGNGSAVSSLPPRLSSQWRRGRCFGAECEVGAGEAVSGAGERGAEQSGPAVMAAVPQNNLREQLRLHSARGALSKVPPARSRPAAFTFRRTHSPAAGPAALRDKDVNTSLGPGAVSRPKDLRVGPPGARPALPGPAGSCVSTPGAPPRSLSVSLPLSGPVASVDDEWDDMDDFDLSGFEKKFSRPAVLSPKGPRTPQGPGLCVSKARGDVGPQEHEAEVCCSQGSSQGSLICLGDAGAPAAAVLSDNGMGEARAATNGGSGESQKLSNGEKSRQLELGDAGNELLADIELEEDDYLDVVPPSPEEELPSFSPSVRSVSNIFKESPTDGRSAVRSTESEPEPGAPKQPAAEQDSSAEHADKGLHLEQRLYSVMADICKLVDAIPLHELTSVSCAKELLQQRELRRKLLADSVALNASSMNGARNWRACVQQDPSSRPATPLCSGPARGAASVGSTPRATELPSVLPRTVNSSSFSTVRNQTLDNLDTSYALKETDQEVICLEAAALSSPRVNGKGCTSLSRPSEASFNGSWCEKPTGRDSGNWHVPERPAASTAAKAQHAAPAAAPASGCSAVDDTDFDLDHFDMADFDEGWEDAAAPEAPPAPRCRLLAVAAGPAPGPHPAAPKSGCGIAAKSSSEPLVRNPAHERFRGMKFSHSEEMLKIFHRKFGLHSFRTNQLEAINAALLGEDCFILMPTGGGKSLCYQLPACVSAGVTVVISPLRSLIIDQVQKLKTLDIAATYLTGDITDADASKIYMQLSKKDPVIKLLYVTPEKVCASNRLLSALENLYDRKLLARFVIDEAHCVSQWGHDFRKDYKRLNMLRRKFRPVPMMALTATANPRVQKDIQNQLEMLKPQVFTMSFNRHNLKYDVLPKKPKKVAMDCLEWIKKYHPHDSGIIYCLSRHECDTTAAILQKEGLAALAYHAGLTDSNRDLVQKKWVNQEGCQVICATIAFGMGIDKPDVRYVIHASLPKSIEGYYQESGRAGRDGEVSHCLLFYSYSDVTRLRRLILMEKDGNSHTRQTHFNNLYSMVHYCENVVDCRRVQLLAYFGETDFNPNFCKDHPEVICDNCSRKKDYKSRNVTDEVKSIVRFVQQHCGQMGGINGNRNTGSGRYTLNMMVDIFLGAKSAKIQSGIFGKGAAYSRHNVERLFRKLVLDKILDEDLYITANDQAVAYVVLGEKAQAVLNGLLQVEFHETENASAIRKQRASVAKMSQREEMVKKCLGELTDTCKTLGKIFDVHYFNIFSTSTLKKIAETLSSDVEVLLQIDGVTEDKLEKYGAEIMKVMDKYSEWASPEDAACQSVDTAPGSAGTAGSEEEAEDTVVTSSYFGGNANQRRKRKRLPNVGGSKRKKTSSGGSQQFYSKGGKYRRTRRAPGSRAAAPQSSAVRGAGARLGIMAPPKPSSRHFLQPSYAVLQ
uniref:RecQ-like DNA helicase BLM n=1 Tax=Pavo cristatus TaxID=9049 RepID=A0A8C9L6T7_PAVCR